MIFELPGELAANAPPDRRDRVRLLIARPGWVTHARFADLPGLVEPGDLVVVNTSATLPAAVDGERADGREITVHFSTARDDGTWLVEVRPAANASGPVPDAHPGERLALPAGATVTLLAPHGRLWCAAVAVEDGAAVAETIGIQDAVAVDPVAIDSVAIDGAVPTYLARHGRPITYSYVRGRWPIAAYQTVFARDPGSAEMPSAGRPFTSDLVTALVAKGVIVAPITLHTGVSSLENGEPPLPERYRVPDATARLVNLVRERGGRVIAVGTTVTRALETVADPDGRVAAGGGWTDLVLGPDRPARAVNGLLTGWHAPGASHLRLLEAVAGADLVASAYRAALSARYRWHEFGDSCLLLPSNPQR